MNLNTCDHDHKTLMAKSAGRWDLQRGFRTLTVWEGENADDQEEGDDQDETHPKVIVRVSIISATETCGHMWKKATYTQPIFLFLFHHSFTILYTYTHTHTHQKKMQSDASHTSQRINACDYRKIGSWHFENINNLFPIDDAAIRVWNWQHGN